MVEQPALAFPHLIEGSRVTLRPWAERDVHAITELILDNLDHLRPFMPWVVAEPMAPEDRIEVITKWRRDFASGTGDAVYAICIADTPVGSCGLHRRGAPDTLEIGYWIGAVHTRQGLVTEVAGLLTEAAFTFVQIDTVQIHHDAANVASSGIPQKLGYAKTDEINGSHVAPGETGRVWVWTMTRDAWFRRGGFGHSPQPIS